MRLSTIIGGSLLAAALPFATVAHPHEGHVPRHNALAHRMSGDVSHLHKRDFSNARFTYYDVGL